MSGKPVYLSFKSAEKRLHALRQLAQARSTDALTKTWRDVREYGHHNWAAAHGDFSQGSNTHGTKQTPVWTTFNAPCFRDEKYADESDAYTIDHTGWFCDEDCDNKARGIIARLSHGRFLAGYELSENGERVYYGKVHADERDAAIWADGYAATAAEKELEYDARYRAAQALDDAIETALHRLRECFALRNHKGLAYSFPRIQARSLIIDIRNNREKLATDYAGVI